MKTWVIPQWLLHQLRDKHCPQHKLDLWQWLEAALTPDE